MMIRPPPNPRSDPRNPASTEIAPTVRTKSSGVSRRVYSEQLPPPHPELPASLEIEERLSARRCPDAASRPEERGAENDHRDEPDADDENRDTARHRADFSRVKWEEKVDEAT